MMMTLSTLAVVVTVPLLLSVACWTLFAGALRRVIALLCHEQNEEAKSVASLFWERIYLALTLFIPLFVVLFLTPTLRDGYFASSLLFALRWSLFGGIALILTLAFMVRRQIVLNQQQMKPVINTQPTGEQS